MNWKLIFTLSLFGLAMGLATAFFIPSEIEIGCWGAIFVICAYIIATTVQGSYFLHGFLVSLVNSVWITASHFIFYTHYIATQSDKVSLAAQIHMADHPHRAMILMGPVFGAGFGIILGGFSWVASMLVKKTTPKTL